MTLDEAIQHCKDEAHVLFQHSAKHRTGTEDSCYECAKEHEQLAEWLTELKQRREQQKHGYLGKYDDCSVCGAWVNGRYENYCANCGAKLDLPVSDEE